jgi:RecA-family ATPase
VSQLIPRGQITVLFGDGGAAKSYFALALAIAARVGQALGDHPRWWVAPVEAVLYLDWEADYVSHCDRLERLSRLQGTGEAPGGIFHRRLTAPLTEVIADVRREAQARKAELVIVDSLAPACGAEPEGADAAIRAHNALRSLHPATVLVVAHVAKSALDAPGGQARPYGSVFVNNLARSTILARPEPSPSQPDRLEVTYLHHKANFGPKQPPSALAYLFDESGYVLISKAEPDAATLPVPAQILGALKAGAKNVASIADELGLSSPQVRDALNRLEKRSRVLRLVEGGQGRGKETLWARTDTKRSTET